MSDRKAKGTGPPQPEALEADWLNRLAIPHFNGRLNRPRHASLATGHPRNSLMFHQLRQEVFQLLIVGIQMQTGLDDQDRIVKALAARQEVDITPDGFR